MSGHAILKIVKGVQKTPGDVNSVEQGLDEVNLLDPLGFSLDSYEMKIPALKSSSVFADNPLADGRTLIVGALGNVTETIRVTITAASIPQMSAMLAKLGRMKQDCNDFWDTFGQIEPVYIKHQVNGEPGPRYALLYDIDIAIAAPFDPGAPTRDLTIVIEREYGWRGIAPGDNPKRWNIENNLGQAFNLANASLIDGTNSLASASLANKTEFATSNTISSVRNFIDIPAEDIPGDLPALVCVTGQPNYDGAGSVDLYISRVSKPLSLPDRNNGAILPHYLDFSAAAGLMGTDTAFTTDTNNGIVYPPVSANLRVATVSFTTTTTATPRVSWSLNANYPHMDTTLLRGRYMVFIRARQNAGALGNTTAYIQYLDGNSGAFATSNTVILPLATDSPTTTDIPLSYMGIVTLPPSRRSQSLMRGGGLKITAVPGVTDNGFSIRLYVARSTGVATVTIVDTILVPIDEACVRTVPTVPSSSADQHVIFDETGYFNHGLTDPEAVYRNSAPDLDIDMPSQLMGGRLNLIPGKTNRLYFLYQKFNGTHANPLGTLNVTVNIVPRWSGLRDV